MCHSTGFFLKISIFVKFTNFWHMIYMWVFQWMHYKHNDILWFFQHARNSSILICNEFIDVNDLMKFYLSIKLIFWISATKVCQCKLYFMNGTNQLKFNQFFQFIKSMVKCCATSINKFILLNIRILFHDYSRLKRRYRSPIKLWI